MNNFSKSLAVLPLTLAMGLAACGDGRNNPAPTPTATPTPSPTPTPTPTPASYDVTPCVTQEVAPGTTVADLVLPDTLKLDLNSPSGFPNGRELPDPVIDMTLAVLFLDMTVHNPLSLAGLPVNPRANDKPFRSEFPFLAPPHGSPPVTTSTDTTFNFRTEQRAEYVRVDRMGMPAVATALIGSSLKNPYNDANPVDDAEGDFVPEIVAQLTALTNALADDVVGAGLTPCAEAEAEDAA